MRAFKIDAHGVSQVDIASDFLETSDQTWDKFDLDAHHDVWVDDEGLFAGNVEAARVGSNVNTPLPAYVLGSAGECVCDASLAREDVKAMVTLPRRPQVT